ncbi:MAG: hypothetical protein LBV17_08700 [Treponema sp.]|jgi:hypothetical protein|nr:hypothetical protein [Treponema sp.]
MIQLYFLSILCNGLGGYILFARNNDEGEETADTIEKNVPFSLNTPTFHLVLGILCAVTGILKLLSPTLDGILILGDLIPSATGIIAGILLIFGIYRQDISAAPENPSVLDRLGVSLLRFRRAVGFGLIVVAFLHFLFPQALFI